MVGWKNSFWIRRIRINWWRLKWIWTKRNNSKIREIAVDWGWN